MKDKIKSHKFLLEVQTTKTRKEAKLDILFAFSVRDPDNCRFLLKKKSPRLVINKKNT